MFNVDLNALISAEAHAFYAQHAHESGATLLLKYAHDAVQRARSMQLEARHRAQKKLPTWFANPAIVFPPKANLEQASSEVTAAYKAQLFNYKTSIDLTGGTGIDSWQLAKRGTRHTYVEPNENLCNLARHNFSVLGMPHVNVVCATAEDFLKSQPEPVDLIYLDPGRRAAGARKVNLHDYQPNVIALLPTLLALAKNTVIKVSPLADSTYLINALSPYCQQVHVVAVKNECKETLLHLTAESCENPTIHAVNLVDDAMHVFRFTRTDEIQKAPLAETVGSYLYEPNAAVNNAGAFNSLAHAFALQKLHPNTQLYTSNHYQAAFPGAVYEVLEVARPYKLSGTYTGVSVASRNFPEQAEQVKKRLKLREGNAFKLFATTVAEKKVFIVGRPTH